MTQLEVRYYKPELRRLGPLTLEVLRLVRIEPLELSAVTPSDAVDRVYDILVNVVERYRGGEPMVVEVRAYLKTGEIAAATLTKQTGHRAVTMLFPRPARLFRIGVGGPEGVKWFDVAEDVYVYHGRVELPESVDIVMLDTEEGLRVITRREVEEHLEELRRLQEQARKRQKRRRAGRRREG